MIETLVVITIISILASLILPLLFRVRAQAVSISCHSNLRQIGMLVQNYARRNSGRLPHEDNGDSRPPFGYGWYKLLPTKRIPQELFHCPAEINPTSRSYKMNSNLEDGKTPFARLYSLAPSSLVLFFDGRVNNRGVVKSPKGSWKSADNRHPDGMHYLTISGSVHAHDSDTGSAGWEGPAGIQWLPARR